MNLETTQTPPRLFGAREHVREWTPQTDRAFVADAWLNVVRAGSSETHAADWSSFRAHHNRQIDRILDDPRTRVRIAGPDELVIHGFLVHRPPGVLHMLFVRKAQRRQGLAKLLLAGVGLEDGVCTHWTKDLERWILDRFKVETGRDRYGSPTYRHSLKFNPYIDEDA